MIYSDSFQDLRNFNIIIDSKLEVSGVSNNILESKIGDSLFNKHINDLFSIKFIFDYENSEIDHAKVKGFKMIDIIKNAFNGNEVYDRKAIFTINTELIKMNYTFFFSLSLISKSSEKENNKVFIIFRDFKKFDSVEERYMNHFDEFEEKFDLIQKINVIGRFILDLEIDKYKVYGNHLVPGLLGLKKTHDNFYKLSSRNDDYIIDNSIIKSKSFYEKIDLLLANKIKILTDEWKVNDKWLKMEAKILTKTSKGAPKLIGGIIYDVTDFQNYKDLESVHLFYELAINSGEIGMFHYDLEKHDSNVFTANKMYADIFGISPNEDEMYKSEDFLNAQLELEEHISKYDSVKVQLNKLINGEVEGTNDDILKIRNLKTGDIKYLLSSSKVDSYYEDGRAKRFGGIAIDITDRIIRERNQAEFLYKDELTLLGNNRALAKNMVDAKDGLGLFFDLDNFKKINDTYGHLMGDKMIKFFGNCLDKVAKEYENITVYRLYGDEFFVFCETRHKSFSSIYERKVKEHLAIKMKTVKEDINLQASMGTSMYKKGSSVDDFIKYADYSMYETKISKKKREN